MGTPNHGPDTWYASTRVEERHCCHTSSAAKLAQDLKHRSWQESEKRKAGKAGEGTGEQPYREVAQTLPARSMSPKAWNLIGIVGHLPQA